jgi:hypothetical protein
MYRHSTVKHTRNQGSQIGTATAASKRKEAPRSSSKVYNKRGKHSNTTSTTADVSTDYKAQKQSALAASLCSDNGGYDSLPDEESLVVVDDEVEFDDGNVGMRCVDGMLFRVNSSTEDV